MKTYYVYILRCADSTYYTGVTGDIEKRLRQHKVGSDSTSYTYGRRPIDLVFKAGYTHPEIAIAFEKKIKKWSRTKKEALIAGDYDMLPELSKKNFEE